MLKKLNSSDWGGKQGIYFLLFLLIAILGVYGYFFYFIDGSYLPYYGDEYFYFKNSENFYLNNSLRAAFTYSGQGSKYLGVDAHGVAYPLIYGLISKLLGWSNQSILWINLGLLICSLMILWFCQELTKKRKLLQMLLVLGSPFVFFYSITFLPELMHIAGGILLYVLISNQQKAMKNSGLVYVALLILGLGLIRSTWFFAFFGFQFLKQKPRKVDFLFFGILGLLLAYVLQQYFHEKVPNVFSDLGESLAAQKYSTIISDILFNIKRNIYFAFTYTEGYFYTVLKLWILCTILFSWIYYRQYRIVKFGLMTLACVMLFNLILYKNYSWVELRMYTVFAIFLNLSMVCFAKKIWSNTLLLSMSLCSFVLILPFQFKIIHHRIDPEVRTIPPLIIEQIRFEKEALILLDTLVIKEYALDQLPLQGNSGQPIRYILPYYSQKMEEPLQILVEENNQLKVRSTKILNQ
ncbi:hypothetical protein [Algoriphagus pacificus]|uniref:Dolichyl-phosphate-mannose-protein mannosyltransferase n=1 Tax=Algoriphagus pacificus TaxID=2811234 RepID=A0ABS3CKC9_9BACT|nr:hypothetical protein [Algoriphagus pacificus]MBN7817537.1 hypothetical protein [Algoriphagus pacificus]